MNLEKFTERSRGFIQAAQTIAMRESHQRLAPPSGRRPGETSSSR